MTIIRAVDIRIMVKNLLLTYLDTLPYKNNLLKTKSNYPLSLWVTVGTLLKNTNNPLFCT
jgi:hypothetical protein